MRAALGDVARAVDPGALEIGYVVAVDLVQGGIARAAGVLAVVMSFGGWVAGCGGVGGKEERRCREQGG